MATWTSQRTGRWNDDAANASSPWNGGANPATGVPASGDTVVIALTHDVEFDADQSGFASGITLTVTGTLHASTTAGSYKLKLGAALTSAGGTIRAGTEAIPYPVTCTFEIIRNAFAIGGTTTIYDLNCSEPGTKWIRLSGVEAIGQTVLSVDTDVTALTDYWKDGATVKIVDVVGALDVEERIIAVGGVAATTITITSGLTAQKEIGAYIVLVDRNVKITHTSAATNAFQSPRTAGSRIFAQVYGFGNAFASGPTNITVGGFVGNPTAAGTGASDPGGLTFSGVFASLGTGAAGPLGCIGSPGSAFLGCSVGTAGGTAGAWYSLFAGCPSGMSTPGKTFFYGSAIGNLNGMSAGSGPVLVNATFQSNATADLTNMGFVTAFNTQFLSTTENNGYNGANTSINNFSESIDHDGVANAYRAWTKGGIIDSDTGTVYPGRTRSYKHGCINASFPVFQNRTFTVQPGGGLVVQCFVRKSALMTYLPRVWILTPGQEPFITGSPNAEDIMTDSVDTWEELNLVYANGGTSPVDVVVRTVAKNGSGNVFFDPIVTVLAPATYDVYNTLLGYVDTIESRIPAALTVDGNIKADIQRVEGTDATDYFTALIATIFTTVIETGLTFKNAMRLTVAAAAAKLSGAATPQVKVRNAVADDKDRITADVDANGNRTNVTYDFTD